MSHTHRCQQSALLLLSFCLGACEWLYPPYATELLLQLEPSEAMHESAGDQAEGAIRHRLAAGGFRRAEVIREKDLLRVRLVKGADLAFATQLLTRRAELELRLVDTAGGTALATASIPEGSRVRLVTEKVRGRDGIARESYFTADRKEDLATLLGPLVSSGRRLAFGPLTPEQVGGEQRFRSWVLAGQPSLTGERVDNARVVQVPELGTYMVAVELDEDGTRSFEELTAAHVGERVAIMLDGMVNSAPVIQEKISGGHLRISLSQGRTAQENQQEARDLALVLKAGKYPLRAKLISTQTLNEGTK